MKTRCPSCGAVMSLDALVGHDAGRAALAAAFALGDDMGRAIVRYLGCFRPATRELSMDRVARLLDELVVDIELQRIERKGQVYRVPKEAWLWALTQVVDARDAGRLKLPLGNHSYLHEVLTSWRPSAMPIAQPDSPPPAQRLSKTAAAVKALEERARGER